MKTRIALAAVALLVAVGIGDFIGMQSRPVAANACSQQSVASESHEVMIMNGKADDPNITAKLCDTLTFMSMDTDVRTIAFGPHENHVPYDGIGEKLISKGQSFTITLNQLGKFHWHDHLHDEVEGYFTVNK